MKGVIFTNDVSVHYFNFINKTSRRIYSTRDAVRVNYPVFFFKKQSILLWMFNRKIEDCSESGLILHWKGKYNQNRRQKDKRGPKKLGIRVILAIMEICGTLYLVAFIVFLLEISSQKNIRLKRCLDYLTY